jgi:hypothetical protein
VLRKINYFKEDTIINFHKKYQLFKILGDETNILIELYTNDKFLNTSIMENYCAFLINAQNSLSLEFGYIKLSEYFICNNSKDTKPVKS